MLRCVRPLFRRDGDEEVRSRIVVMLIVVWLVVARWKERREVLAGEGVAVRTCWHRIG